MKAILAPNPDRSLHAGLWLTLILLLGWSYVGCHDRFTWFLETAPIFIGSAFLLAVYERFRFTRLVCWLLWLHAIVLLVGGHYTYAEVPLLNWIRDAFHLSRNHYDRLGHFFQGFVPAMVAREILLRKGVLKRGGWLFFIVVCVCLAISASYELFEAYTAMLTGGKADAFLGSQGDPWDTQWDMTFALVGAVTAQLALPSVHDAALRRFEAS
ncbi:MAG: DUF2238 domain-containing protein [Elusimicrobia bacterium]|nr:DUF2238 domain-containing protein [Elusimicrobiota bacterium]